MKILTILICLVARMGLMFTCCRAQYPVSQQGGKDDVAYLLFVGQEEYAEKKVEVSLDNGTPFSAEVVEAKDAHRKGTQYAVGIGTRSIKVTFDGKVLYEKKLFLSSQEVKKIMLP